MKWTSVNEEMPDENVKVLVCISGTGLVTAGIWNGQSWVLLDQDSPVLSKNITHWVQFPLLPVEEAKVHRHEWIKEGDDVSIHCINCDDVIFLEDIVDDMFLIDCVPQYTKEEIYDLWELGDDISMVEAERGSHSWNFALYECSCFNCGFRFRYDDYYNNPKSGPFSN